MRLPQADEAIISAEKLRNYLLSGEHPVGRFKAVFFRSLGYSANDWPALEADLRAQHLPLDATEGEPSRYGRRFTIRGPLTGPSGRTVGLVTVWVIRMGEEVPCFVTAYPGGRR